MSDNITLPREVAEQVLKALEFAQRQLNSSRSELPPTLRNRPGYSVEITALRTFLAAPRLAVTVDPRLTPDEAAAILSALAAPQSEQTHPGYVIGSHWLETAYSRVCAGEAEANVLRDYGLVREEAFLTGVAHLKAENEALRRDAERYRYLRNRDPNEVFGKSGRAAGVWIDWEDDMAGLQLLTGDDADAAIDAAMQEDKT